MYGLLSLQRRSLPKAPERRLTKFPTIGNRTQSVSSVAKLPIGIFMEFAKHNRYKNENDIQKLVARRVTVTRYVNAIYIKWFDVSETRAVYYEQC